MPRNAKCLKSHHFKTNDGVPVENVDIFHWNITDSWGIFHSTEAFRILSNSSYCFYKGSRRGRGTFLAEQTAQDDRSNLTLSGKVSLCSNCSDLKGNVQTRLLLNFSLERVSDPNVNFPICVILLTERERD